MKGKKDIFSGHQRVREFSARLAVGENPGDEEVAEVLGQEVVVPFRYAQDCLRGLVRRTTGEPAFCHSADIALRALDLGYPDSTLVVCLLHDTVEDRSSSPAELSRCLAEVGRRFEAPAQDVRLCTNRYSVLLRSLGRRVPPDLPFQQSSLEPVRKALRKFEKELPHDLSCEFEHEFRQFLDYFLDEVDLSRGAQKARIDSTYTVLAELRLQSYRLFVEEIADDARTRKAPAAGTFHENPLVTKSLDLVDNLRTSEVSSLASLQRILFKSETLLDASFYLHDYVRQSNNTQATFILLYDYLKHHLVEQLWERKRALASLADTRFAYLADFLVQEISRLQQKYKVGEFPVTELDRIRDSIRELNESCADPHV
ncbi:MAG: hypothetical protein ACE5JX_17230 [Acidobacteriota bacterium]